MYDCKSCGTKFKLSFFDKLIMVSKETCSNCTTNEINEFRNIENQLKKYTDDNYIDKSNEIELLEKLNKLYNFQNKKKNLINEIERLERLRCFNDEELPKLLCTNLILKDKEICHCEVKVRLLEYKNKTTFVGGSAGVSVRVAKGVSVRVGRFKGSPQQEQVSNITDEGTLSITNKRIVFNGEKKNITYSIDKIANFYGFDDRIQFIKENEAGSKFFLIPNKNIIIEMVIILNRLFKNDYVSK